MGTRQQGGDGHGGRRRPADSLRLGWDWKGNELGRQRDATGGHCRQAALGLSGFVRMHREKTKWPKVEEDWRAIQFVLHRLKTNSFQVYPLEQHLPRKRSNITE
jgi:hypothetical protein